MAHLKARGFIAALPLVALFLVLTTPLRAGVPGSTQEQIIRSIFGKVTWRF